MSPVMLLTFLCVFSHFVPHINGISNENNFRVMVALHGGMSMSLVANWRGWWKHGIPTLW